MMLLITAIFIAGVVYLFALRFEKGDIYPAYSSLRSDPLGTKVLYESIDNLQDVSIGRNYKPFYKLQHDSTSSFFYLGADAKLSFLFTEKDMKSLESMISGGGQLLISFIPEQGSRSKNIQEHEGIEADSEDPDISSDRKEDNKDDENDPETPLKLVDPAKRWGYDLAGRKLTCESDCRKKASGILIANTYDLPDSILWHSSLYFRSLDASWNTVYAVDGLPVMIERTFGNGKIILSTDTYFLSNEAMLKARYSDLLVWLIGSNRTIIFDETHFGIVERPGISSLFKKYRLHWPGVGLLLLVVLFIWKNSSSLVPPDNPGYGRDITDRGKDYISGFVSLLRRHVTPRELLDICYSEWEKTNRINKKFSSDILNEVNSIIDKETRLPVKQRNPVKTYQDIYNFLSKRRHG